MFLLQTGAVLRMELEDLKTPVLTITLTLKTPSLPTQIEETKDQIVSNYH